MGVLDRAWAFRAVIFFLVALLIRVPANSAGIDPNIQWEVLETKHFYVIFDKKQFLLGKMYARAAEEAYGFLVPVFQEAPEKTTVLIIDNNDSANGSATFFPYPIINILPVLPKSTDSVSHYDRWELMLMLHEYAHILTFEPAHGMYTPFKYIFGTVVRPAALLPLWYQEGLAVEMESYFTPFGRLKSEDSSAILRALVESGKLEQETIDRINESSIKTWPYGSRPYIFGSLIWQEIIREKGLSAVNQLGQIYSRRVPFILDGPLEDLMNKTWEKHLTGIYAKITASANRHMNTIKANPQKQYSRLNAKSLGGSLPTLSPDGKYLLYIGVNEAHVAELRLRERDPLLRESFTQKNDRVLFSINGTTKISWLPDSKSFVFDQRRPYKRYYSFGDLYHYNIPNKKFKQLTRGMRAIHPDVSSDGKEVVFVRQRGGGTEIKVFNFSTKAIQSVIKPILGVRISSPTFTNNGNILFIGRRKNGRQGFFIYNRKTKKRQAVLRGYGEVRMAKKTHLGVLFSSDKSGIRNLYLANDELDLARPLTNVATGAITGDLDPIAKELYLTRLTGEGARIFVAKNFDTIRPPKVKRVNEQTWPNVKNTVQEKIPMVRKPYSSWRYMWPRYWTPFIYPVENGLLFQGTTSAFDPVNRHSYVLNASYDTVTEQISHATSYMNRQFAVGLGGSYAESNSFLNGSGLVVKSQSASLQSSFYVPGLSGLWSGAASWSFIDTQLGSVKIKRTGPHLGLGYSKMRPQAGGGFRHGSRSLSLGASSYLKGADRIAYERYTLSGSYVFAKFLPKQHSFLTQLKTAWAPDLPLGGVIILGDKTVSGNFLASLITSSYLMRGYPSATFNSKKIVNLNFEYRLPLWSIYKGRGLFPLFLRNLDAAVIVDGVAIDGAFYSSANRQYEVAALDRNFWSAGMEFKLKTTVAYHLPLSLILGLYHGFDKDAGGGFKSFLGVGLSGHPGVNTKNTN